MGYPGDDRSSPYGEWPADTPPGQYGGGDPYRPGDAAAPGGHDPLRGYPPLQDPAYGTPGPSGPYGPPASPYGDPSGQGYAPAGPQPDPSGYGHAPSGPQPGYGYAPSGPQQPTGPGGWPPPSGYGMPPGGPPPGKGGGKLPLIIGGIIGAVVLLGGGGTALAFAMSGGDDPAPRPTKTAAQPTPTSPAPSPTTTSTAGAGRWLKIASRSTDPKPLTMGEVFGRTRLSDHGRSYRQVARQVTDNCTAVVTGGRLRGALSSGDCTQLLRATYLRGDGKVMGTVSISNLSDSSGVRRAFSAAAGGRQYVTPLRGSAGRTAKLGRGAALGIRQVKGHYLILSWVQYADGHKPASAAGRKQLSAFHADVVSTTLTRPLSYRMITGRPKQ